MSATPKHPVVMENVVCVRWHIGTTVSPSLPRWVYTLLLMLSPATAPALYSTLPFDPVCDFAPIGLVTDYRMILGSRAHFRRQ